MVHFRANRLKERGEKLPVYEVATCQGAYDSGAACALHSIWIASYRGLLSES